MSDMNDITSRTPFRVGEWDVEPDSGYLLREDIELKLEPKVMEVLIMLAKNHGRVVSREELEATVWAGSIVGYDAISGSVIKLRKALGDDSRNPRYIETVSKKGYRLIATIGSADEDHKQPAETPLKPVLRSWAGLMSITLILLVVLIGFMSGPDVKVLPSVIVLPFENQSMDARHDVFIDGMTEDVITDLSRLANLSVMASNTSFGYKGRTVSPQDVRNELKVDYMLQGNIRRSDDAIRINVRLVDTKTGFNTWAERYDRKVTKVFSVQSEVTNNIVKALSVKITSKEKQLLSQKATINLGAYDFFQEGQRISKISTKETNVQAREVFRKSIELDPTYGRAYGAIAYTLAFDFLRGWSDTPIETLERALALAEQAVALNDSVPQTYWALGYVFLMRKEFEKAQKAAAQAISIAPNYADGYGLLALISNNLGESEKAIEYITKGMHLNPYYTWDYPYNLGRANYMLGNYDAAIAALEEAQERNENVVPVKMFLATSYVKAGRLEDADWTVEQIQVLNPGSSLSHIDKTIPIVDSKLRKNFLDDLRTAGLPE